MYGSTRTARILLVLLLIVSSAQCMMACAAGPCETAGDNNLPPCHRHHVPAGHTAPSCSHPLAIDMRQASTTQFALNNSMALPLAAMACLAPTRTTVEQSCLLAPAPPGVVALSTVILRI
ncbi:MAG TPA: hypothetical protein VH302_11180 [Bryobacteraceae bacterium]|jgi:hypothetical protein|nr:hypothetical protein [Bryobacteraceae bacterium]